MRHNARQSYNNKHDSLHLGRKYARIFVLGHYLFLETHSFPRAMLSENFSEKIMSADKYPSMFSRQTEAIVCFINGLSRLRSHGELEGELLRSFSQFSLRKRPFFFAPGPSATRARVEEGRLFSQAIEKPEFT